MLRSRWRSKCFKFLNSMKILLSYNFNELMRSIHKDPRWATKEWSWLCKAELIDWDYHVTDIFFPTQKNQTAHTVFTKEPMDELAAYLIEENRLDDFGKYCVWLHSHQKMSAFRSWEDRSTRKWFKDRGADWFLSIVTSSTKWTNDCMWVFYHATLDVFSPVDFDIDLEVKLWLPCTVTEERPTESFRKYRESLENLANNAEQIKQRFWLSDEQIAWLMENDFSWNKTQTYYTEPREISLNIEAKKAELAAVEEVSAYLTKNYENWYRDQEWIWRNYWKKKQETLRPEEEGDVRDKRYADLLS